MPLPLFALHQMVLVRGDYVTKEHEATAEPDIVMGSRLKQTNGTRESLGATYHPRQVRARGFPVLALDRTRL